MAKKQQIHNAAAGDQCRIALGFLSELSAEQREEHKKIHNLAHISPLSGAAMLDDLQKVDADLYVISASAEHFRNQYINELELKNSNRINSNAYYTIVSGSNKGRLTELFSGIGPAEWQNSGVAFGRQAFEKFCDENIIPTDSYELAYLAEKTCANGEIFVADKKTVATISIANAITKKLSVSRKYYMGGGKKAIHKFVFIALSFLALIVGAIMSRDAGISGDEFTQYEYSKLTANYYESILGIDIHVDTLALKGQKMVTLASKAASGENLSDLATQVDPDKLMHLYGASFDTITTLFIRWFGITDVMDFRHLINSFFGFLCMFFGALIIRRVTGGSWKYAWISLIILFFTPRILGDGFNNPKDIPFAAGFAISIYYAIKAFANPANMRFSALLGLVYGTALGISIRIGGLLSIAIFMMYAGLQYIQSIGGLTVFLKFKWPGFLRYFITLIVLGLASYLFGILFWPYGFDDPFTNPITAFKGFSNYGGSIRQLFEGKLFDSDMLPRYYLFKYVFITTPIVAIIGMLLNLVFPAWKKTHFNNAIFLIFFSAVFPVLYIFIQKAQVYGGLRHILFTIPFFVLSGIIGYYLIEQWLKEKKWAAYAVPAFALALTTLPAGFILKNHPLEYIYFNEFVGGTAGAYGNYEMDYYLAGLRPSTEWFLKNVARKNPEKKYTVLTYGMDQVKYYCRNDKNVKVGFTRYDDRSEKAWDYSIFYNAYLDKARLMSKYYPPAGTVFTPIVAGKPMGLVIKRPSMADQEGFMADREKNYRLAQIKYSEYLKADPNSNEVYLYLSSAYANLGNLDSAIWAAKKSVELYPEFTKALIALNQYYVGKQDFANAAKVMDQYLEARPKDPDAWMMKGQALGQMGKYDEALTCVRNGIEINFQDVRFYQLGAAIYQAKKDNINLNLFAQAIKAFTGKTDQEKQEGAQAIQGIYMDITGKDLPQQ